MVEEKEPKGITRRQFLKGITALGASALLSSCGVEEKPSGEEPTKAPSPTEKVPPTQTPVKTKEPTLIPSREPSPTPEIISIAGTTITADYLSNAFAGIGGEEIVANGQEEVSLVQFGQGYVSSSWGEEVDFAKLSEDPISSLKYLISLGTYQGREGVFTPGKQGEEIIFPQLKDLSLPRLILEKIPLEGEQKEQEYPERVSPQGLLLRPQTQMTVVGLLNQPKSEEEITVDKEVAAGELNFALVSFTDYLRSSEEGVPRHYLAVLPTHLPADSDNKNALALKNLLETNGYQYDSEANELTLVDPQTQEQTKVGLNRIEGEDLIKDLRKATGLAFVDRMNDKLIKNPVVPYPEEMPAVWEIRVQKAEEDGSTFISLWGASSLGEELTEVSQARYVQEEEAWHWAKEWRAIYPFSAEIDHFAEVTLEEALAMEKASREAGELKFFMPREFIASGGELWIDRTPNGYVGVDGFLPDGKEAIFPAMLSGRIIQAGKCNDNSNCVVIETPEGIESAVGIPLTAQILVKNGDEVVPGQPLFTIKSDWANSLQEAFLDSGGGWEFPKGTVVLIDAWNLKDNLPVFFSKDSFFRNDKGEIVLSPKHE